MLRVKVKLSLLKVKDVQNFTALELLLIEISNAVDSLFVLSFLYDINVGSVFKIRLNFAPNSSVLDSRLHFFGPVSEDVS